MTITRRDLVLGTGAFASLRLFGKPLSETWGLREESLSCELIPRSNPPLALETPRSGLQTWLTPGECFYVFNHNSVPRMDSSNWKLRISGAVEMPTILRWGELGKFDEAEVVCTLECAGNGRGLFDPPIEGVQWICGAVGNAVFHGIRLGDVLERAKLKGGARHVALMGLDLLSPADGDFVRSIPLEKALDPNTLLALRMNGKKLSPEHGSPIRAVVPGWIGAASVKRLKEIRVLEHEADSEFMRKYYRLPDGSSSGNTAALTSLQVKSLITKPLNPSANRMTPIRIEGLAWAGELGIAKVELSFDKGKTWLEVSVLRSKAKYAWSSWQYAWKPLESGRFTISVRATDTAGNAQPERSKWNRRGYFWNGIDSIKVGVS